MKNLTPELTAKLNAAKTAEELFALAKENNVELTEEEAKAYFAQISENGAINDDALEAVAGGRTIFGDSSYKDGEIVDLPQGLACSACGCTKGVVSCDASGAHVKCKDCEKIVIHLVSAGPFGSF